MSETAPALKPETCSAPEQGQIVRVRNRLFLVRDSFPHVDDSGVVLTRLDLECLDDDRLGEGLSVLWEREVNTQVQRSDAIPVPSGRWDHPRVFDAFLTAIRWSSSSVLRSEALQSAFRGAIELEPAARAVLMPRVNLLIADDTGLGKTIEAGLVIQELLARARIRNCLVVCPASLQTQWKEEMEEKFDLEFRIIDRDSVLSLRREYGVHVNPWRSYPRLITSIDYLKRESVLLQFDATHEGNRAGAAALLETCWSSTRPTTALPPEVRSTRAARGAGRGVGDIPSPIHPACATLNSMGHNPYRADRYGTSEEEMDR